MSYLQDKYINPFTDYGFKKLFETAEIARFTPEQVRTYEDSLKYYRDLQNSLDTARDEGEEAGMERVARKLLKGGYDIQMICDTTGLTPDQVERLR